MLELTIQRRASDLHIICGLPPYLRIEGVLAPVNSAPIVTQDVVDKYLREILSADNLERFYVNKELDFSLAFSAKARFRVNAYTQKNQFAISFRMIPIEISAVDDLGLPKIVHSFANLRQGFILITGPTGHGKSTTLAAILNEINQIRACHIVTIEDPIEFVFRPRNSIISQREMGSDTLSWQVALRSVLREDPDVVMVGEMRGTDTMSTAVTAAETGHLVLSTLHTNNAAQTIDRIIDSFAAEQQQQIRVQLAGSLIGIFSQRLVPRISGGMIPAYELLINNAAVSNLIRENRTHEINTVIETSSGDGMIDMNRCLADLVRRGEVTPESAFSRSLNPSILERLL